MLVELAINVFASVILIAGGYFGGMYRERRAQRGKNLEDYDFYPFGTDELGNVYFDPEKLEKILFRRYALPVGAPEPCCRAPADSYC